MSMTVEEEEQLAAEGYRFYAEEAAEFASATARAVAEAICTLDDSLGLGG